LIFEVMDWQILGLFLNNQQSGIKGGRGKEGKGFEQGGRLGLVFALFLFVPCACGLIETALP